VREHPRVHSSHETSEQPKVITDLVNAPSRELQDFALQQLHEMELSGAIIAEKIAPIAIRSPIQPLAPSCIITSRWVGGGVFGAVFPLEDGALLSGWITIRAALRMNPLLTPLGTLSSEPWDKDLYSQKRHLLPSSVSLHGAGHAAAQEVAVQLLREFPERLDISKDGNATIDSSSIARRFIKAKRTLLEREIQEGFTLVTEEDSSTKLLQSFIIQAQGDFFEMTIRKSALKIFRETRLDIIHISHEQDPNRSLIGTFIESATRRATHLAGPLVRELLRRNPLSPTPLDILTRPSVAGIAHTLAAQQLYRDLWSLLPVEERESMLNEISQNAWRRASYAYAQSN
jgi:hypothetical protein